MQLYYFRTDHVFTAVLFLFRFRFGLFSFFFCREEVNARVVPEIKSDLARTSSVGFNFLASAGITSLSN